MILNYWSVLVAAVLQFIVGAIWYMPLFGELWGKIHHVPKMSKAEQKKMMKTMMPMLAVQFGMTIVTSMILAIFITYQPTWNPYAMAGFFWLGFVVPTQVSAVIFGGTDPKWILKKIAIMAGGSLVCLELAATVIHFLR